MAEKIALTVDNESKLCAFSKSAYLKVLTRINNTWQQEALLPLELNVKSTNELRINIRTVIASLPTCKILLSAGISGIPYHIFDKMGFSIFEASDENNNLLNEIIADVINNQQELASENLIPRTPIEITDGCYYLDYMLLESKHPEVTTKKALLPFLDNTPFISLSVRCSHLPPWLEFGEYARNLEITTKQAVEGLLVNIRHKVCEE